MLRGLDQYEDDCDRVPLAASGIVFIDGGGHDRVARRAAALQARGFSTAILRDSDRADMPAGEAAFISSGGVVFSWQAGRALLPFP